MRRALIAMSGGVDSSLAAKLMVDAGFSCLGCTMKLYRNEDAGFPQGHPFCSAEDIDDARSVAYQLGMPFYVFNFTDDFHRQVICPFAESYENGLTPNPCILCNRTLKFDKLLARARLLGCHALVTGHYARISQVGGQFLLKKAIDPTKDQSYVLYFLTQEQLAHIRFPLGQMTKNAVRAMAEKHHLINAGKPDSQDICFVPDGDYAAAIERLVGQKSIPGNFLDTHGHIIGHHRGIIHYTIGQRRGLGLSGSTPLYVCRIDPHRNEVILGSRSELFSDHADVGDVNWISGHPPSRPFRAQVKIRYHQPEQAAVVFPQDKHRFHLEFDVPQRAITPGQAAVLYDGDTVLGGGTILPL